MSNALFGTGFSVKCAASSAMRFGFRDQNCSAAQPICQFIWRERVDIGRPFSRGLTAPNLGSTIRGAR